MEIVLALLLLAADDAYRRGVLALKQNDLPAATSALEEARQATPADPMVWLALAEARLRSGDLARASQAAERAGQLAPADAIVRQGRAMLYSRLGRWDQAVALNPSRLSYRVGQARALLDQGQEKSAESALRSALRAFPAEAELHRLLGLALYAQGRREAAADAFLAAIDLAPTEETLYASLETLLPLPSRRAGIETRLRRYTAEQPGSPLGWYLLALATEDPAGLERALQADPDFWPAAFALHREVSDDRALVLLERVVTLHPDYAPAHYALAQLYAKQGQREKALAARKRHHELTASPRPPK